MATERLKMTNILKQLVSESPEVSSSRFLALFWGVGAFLVWGVHCFWHNGLFAIPESIVCIVLGLSGTKTIQTFAERKTPKKAEEPDGPPNS